MRLRRQPQAKDFIKKSELLLANPQSLRGHWRSVFASGPLDLEIGMGKGIFISNCALYYPERNFVGLELREEMLMAAIRRFEGQKPANLRFLWLNALLLPEIFAEGEIDTIYLNFSDPWPKKRHAKRRLTHQSFLHIYAQILRPQGQLFFKTDNRDFYFWSLDSFKENNWLILEQSENLPPAASGLMTEYEQKFRLLGQPIYYCHLQKPDR